MDQHFDSTQAKEKAIRDFVYDCFFDSLLYYEPAPTTPADATVSLDAMRDYNFDLPDGITAHDYCYWWNYFCNCYRDMNSEA